MEIREATIKDREAIFKIWLSCFTDDQDYINSYLDYCFPYTTTLLLGNKTEGDVSVISILPSYFKSGKTCYRGAYLYGVATLQEHRGHSYSLKLINYGIELLKKEGIEYFLVKPATDTLFSLYRKFGFTNELFTETKVISFTTEKKKAIKRVFKDISFADDLVYFREREKLLSDSTFLWPREILSYTIREILERGGFVIKDILSGNFCAGYPSNSGSTLDILETSARADSFTDIFGEELIKRYPQIKRLEVSYPLTDKENNPKTLSALIMELTPNLFTHCRNYKLSLPME
ncbi:MAG: GNAT family N-acetyltransferase [Bacteroidales bacterium]